MFNKFKNFVLASATFLTNFVSGSKPFVSIWGDCDNSLVENDFYYAGKNDGISQAHTEHCHALENDFAQLKLHSASNEALHTALDKIQHERCGDLIPTTIPTPNQFEQQLKSNIPLSTYICGAVLAAAAYTACCKSKRR